MYLLQFPPRPTAATLPPAPARYGSSRPGRQSPPREPLAQGLRWAGLAGWRSTACGDGGGRRGVSRAVPRPLSLSPWVPTSQPGEAGVPHTAVASFT